LAAVLVPRTLGGVTANDQELGVEPNLDIRRLIDIVGLKQAIDQIGADRVINELGLKQIIDRAGLKQVIEVIGQADILARARLFEVDSSAAARFTARFEAATSVSVRACGREKKRCQGLCQDPFPTLCRSTAILFIHGKPRGSQSLTPGLPPPLLHLGGGFLLILESQAEHAPVRMSFR